MKDRPNYLCDMHTHTTRSDGADTPFELISNASEKGMKVIAITDHDIRPPETVDVDGKKIDVVTYAKQNRLELIRGIEISCETEIEDVHIVCLNCDWNDRFFDELEDAVPRSKIESYKELTKALTENKMPISWEEVLDNGGSPIDEKSVQKKMIFELMARKGYAKDWQTAKLMVKNTPEYQIKRRKPEALKVMQEIKRMDGICILAHPYLIAETVKVHEKTMSREEFVDLLIEEGLDGIEAVYPYDKTSYGGILSKEDIAEEVLKRYKDRLSIISGGSDYHADHKKGIQNSREIGEAGITYEYFSNNQKLAKLVSV